LEEDVMENNTPAEVEATGTIPIAGTDTALTRARRPVPSETPEWVAAARDGITQPGRYLAYDESGRKVVVPVSREWTRIGRSLGADVRFDDATVSRRHALIVNDEDGVRVLDDRSLNGVYVNGARVESRPLSDGDQITVGRHSLYYLDTATVGSPAEPAVAAAD
jgi:pSer/pThr/pTyr-binding forkhead associated (FHA) protein